MLRVTVGREWRAAVDTYLSEYRRLHASVRVPFPGIRPLLDQPAMAGVPLGLVTGKGVGSTRVSLHELGLNGAFSVVESGSADGPVKTEKIRGIVAVWRMEPSRIVYVGDHPHDVLHAHEADVMAVAAAWSKYANSRELAAFGPDVLVHSVGAFAEWIDGEIRPR